MKFITRSLYDYMQTESPDADALWEERCTAYQAHLHAIRNQLPTSMREFCHLSLHDSLVTATSRLDGGTLRLTLDTSNAPWCPDGLADLLFTGVVSVSRLDSIVDQVWLYDEIHLHPDAAFEYRVLFEKSELHVVACDVAFRSASS